MNYKEVLKDALPILERSSPIIAGALGSPIAGMAVSLIASALGSDPSDPHALVGKILNDLTSPDKLAALESLHSPALSALLNMRQPSKLDFHLVVEWADSQRIADQS